jgi:hypothetical protein
MRLAILCNYTSTLSGPLTWFYHLWRLRDHFIEHGHSLNFLEISDDPLFSGSYFEKLGIQSVKVTSTSKVDYDKIIIGSYVGPEDFTYYKRGVLPPWQNFLHENPTISKCLVFHDDHYCKPSKLDSINGGILHVPGLTQYVYWRPSTRRKWLNSKAMIDRSKPQDIMVPMYSMRYNKVHSKLDNSLSIIGRMSPTKGWAAAETISNLSEVEHLLMCISKQVFWGYLKTDKERSYSTTLKTLENYLPSQIVDLISDYSASYNVTSNVWGIEDIEADVPLEWSTLEIIDACNIPIVNQYQHKVLTKLNIVSVPLRIEDRKSPDLIRQSVIQAMSLGNNKDLIISNRFLLRNYLSDQLPSLRSLLTR